MSVPQPLSPSVVAPTATSVLILANPTAGAGATRASRARALKVVQARLEASGHSVHIGLEVEPRAIRERAENAARAGTPIVVAAGGDGTVNAVINGLMRASQGGHSPTKLGILPL